FFKPISEKKPNDKLVIISVGRMAWKKGYEYGLQAVASLKQKKIPFEYRIIADGRDSQPVRFAISELGLEQEVKLLGSKTPDEIKEELDAADVFLHPAVSEGFSNAVLEAQAMGLPVITTGADGLSENVADGVTGFVVPVYDVAAMAVKLEWCYHNREQLNNIGKAGIERVKTHFRIEDQVKNFEQFYKSLNE
ncbi:MAG: glycosyltransferase family 4 protein, partial [Chitinophagaceae bacterium]|nr:glycosyltransferase family 4 protein [Chitinophagaceae bacterium]